MSEPTASAPRSPRFLAAALLAGLAASACAPARGGPTGGASARPALNATLWMQRSAEYGAVARLAYRTARRSLDGALADAGRSALVDGSPAGSAGGGDRAAPRPPAVIVDVDETVLSNAPFQARLARTGSDFDPALWGAWVREEKARPVPGARDFLRSADRRGVDVYYVTNRDHELEAATRRNLEALGFPLDAPRDPVLTRGEREGWGSDKASRRAAVARHHRVLLLVGDDLNDFVSVEEAGYEERTRLADRHRDRWGRTWIMLPNPAYGSWEGAAYGHRTDLSPAERRERKLESLDPARGSGGGE